MGDFYSVQGPSKKPNSINKATVEEKKISSNKIPVKIKQSKKRNANT